MGWTGDPEWVRKVPQPPWWPATQRWRPRDDRRAPVYGYPVGPALPIALVGEGPGKDEESYGVPLVGATGQETDRHLTRVGLDRALCLATNVSTTRPDADGALGQPNDRLLAELDACDPAVIMTLGRHAARYFLGDVDLEAVHGIPHAITPWWRPEGASRLTILPAYHPAAGMHKVELSAHVAHDFDLLPGVLAGIVTPREGSADRYPCPAYYDVTDADEQAVHGDSAEDPDSWITPDWDTGVAIDTEGSVARPSMLSWCAEPGTAYVLRTPTAPRQIQVFGEALRLAAMTVPGFVVWLHNSLHDLAVLAALGIDLIGWDIPFVDTMVLAYQLCVEPQGLKALALRHAGMTMQSYTDLVGPYTHAKAVAYLAQVANDDTFPQREVIAHEIKGGVRRTWLKRPKRIHKTAERVLLDLAQDKRDKDGAPVDPYHRWHKIDPDDRAPAEARYGELTEAPLEDVPIAQQIPYAARDADATKRIGPILLARHRAVFGDEGTL